jgi:hypothetical protein
LQGLRKAKQDIHKISSSKEIKSSVEINEVAKWQWKEHYKGSMKDRVDSMKN